jgi:hypothetical protein
VTRHDMVAVKSRDRGDGAVQINTTSANVTLTGPRAGAARYFRALCVVHHLASRVTRQNAV